MVDTTYEYTFTSDQLNNGTNSGTVSGDFTSDYDTLRANGTITVSTPDGNETFNIVNANISNGSGDPNQFTVSGTASDGANISLTYTSMTPTSFDFGDYQPANGSASYQLASGAPVTSTDTTTCYVEGSSILTASGNVAIEKLKVGDIVVTSSGAERPIKWLGHRTIDCRHHPRRNDVLPIRIAAHAFGKNRPAQDLFVSRHHAICVDVLGETLIPINALINGATVHPVEVDEVTYWHVELDSHDIILAENMPAESYMDAGNRRFFQEADVVDLGRLPDAPLRTIGDFCRPYVFDGPIVEAVRAQLRRCAEGFGWQLSRELDLHLEVDGIHAEMVIHGLTARFAIPAGAEKIVLVTPTARPSETEGTMDDRDLGICLRTLRIEDGFSPPREISADDPRLVIGFHNVDQGGLRWTAGRAELPSELWHGCEDGFYLRIDFCGQPVPRWVKPKAETSDTQRPKLVAVA